MGSGEGRKVNSGIKYSKKRKKKTGSVRLFLYCGTCMAVTVETSSDTNGVGPVS